MGIGSLSTELLALVFLVASVATWIAGIGLSKTTDVIDRRFGLGDALGGLILLAVAGSLPELAITITAASKGNLDLAAGNLIGGIAIQTMVIVLCDAAASRTQALTYLVGSLIPVLEALLVVMVVAEVMMGALLPVSDSIGPVSPASIAIVVTWLAGIAVLNRVRKAPAWEIDMPGSKPGRRSRRHRHPSEPEPRPGHARMAVVVFTVASVVTLIAGVVLEESGNALADRAGVNGVIFGATVLATASALPEISSGIAAVRIGDHALAVADIFGGNAFQVALFLVADLVAGKPVLPYAGNLNAWLAGLGIILTVVYAWGVIVRREACIARLGRDSIIVVAVFALGIAGLVAVSNG
jgi:cation:H+ antiporter